MKSFAKAIITVIMSVTALFITMNFLFFFPWYLTIVYEAFQISQEVAQDNYLKYSIYEERLEDLKNKPIFNKRPDSIEIIVENANGDSAIGEDDETIYFNSISKPYLQRGEIITITIKAEYLVQFPLLDNTKIETVIPAEFTLKTTGTKYYKDLDYYEDIP
ncbi:hypothetical protein [Defluviitalea phaphyphila]|uniref:hypothetical protein n=1 Tax=Defluviitalea phaphyphila TaxID=1473580 RepID=UPI0007302AB1|nr:hypothetical protein [Defluviitalea phaphyphila]